MTVAELVTKFTADTKNFTQGTNKVKNETQGLTGKMGGLGKSLGGVNLKAIAAAGAMGALVIAIKKAVEIGIKAVKIFAEFEQTMANVRSVTKATDEEFYALSAAAKEAGRTTRFTATEAADALYYLASAGFTAAQSTEALDGVLLLAGATGSDLASTASTMTAIISQYGLEASEAARVSNVFAAAIANSQATMEKLSGAFTQVGPVAAGLGISLEETTGALQILFNAGYKGEQAGRALKSALADLATESSVANQKLSMLGVSFEDVNPEAVGLEESIRVLNEAGLTTADTMDVFGKVAGPQMSVLIREGAKALEQYTEAVTDTNEAAEQYAIQNDTLKGDMDILKSVTQSMGIEFGEGLAPAIREVVQGLTGIIQFLSPVIRLIGDVAGGILGLVTGPLKMLGEGLGIVGDWLNRILDLDEQGLLFSKKKVEVENELTEAEITRLESIEHRHQRQAQILADLEEERRLQEEIAAIEEERRRARQATADESYSAIVNGLREIGRLEEINAELGREYNAEAARSKLVLDEINRLAKEGFGLQSGAIQYVLEQYGQYITVLDEVEKKQADERKATHDAKAALIEEQERQTRSQEAAKQALVEEKEAAEELKKTYISIALSIPGQIGSIFSAIQNLRQANTTALLSSLDAEAAARIAAGEDELKVNEEIERKKAKIEYEGALASWKLQLASSVAAGSQAVLNGFLTKPFIPAGLIAGGLATTLAGLEIAAVRKAKPQKTFATGTQSYTVPDGFPNDSFNIGLTSGERFSVDTRNQQTDDDNRKQLFQFMFDTSIFFEMINRGIESRKIRIPS